MRNLICQINGEMNNDTCFACFALTPRGDKKFSTRAACVQKNGIYITEPYVKMKEGYIPTPDDEFIYSLVGMDDDMVFEIDNVVWLCIDKMKECVTAIKTFTKNIERIGYERVPYHLVTELELEGTWYRRIRRQ